MQTQTKWMLAVATCLIAVVANRAVSQEGASTPDAPDMAKMMAEWQKSTQPNEHHDLLLESVGEWKAEMKMFMAPGVPPMVTQGEAKITEILGGRFIEEHFKGEIAMPDIATGAVKRLPFEGRGMLGFDNNRQLYVGSWADNMNTAIHTFSGTLPPGSDALNMYGEMDEPMLGIYGRMVRYRTTWEGKNKRIFEMFDLAAGEDYRVLEVTYTRK